MKRNFKLIQAGKDILFRLRIGKGKLAKFLAALRDYGMEVRYLMNRANRMSNKQFVVACVVSIDEIRDESQYIIEDSFNSLSLMEMQNVNTRQRFLTIGRIIVLMNIPYLHGEARLLDPERKLLDTYVKDISDIERERKSNSNKDFLKELYGKFRHEHGNSERSILVVYSHLIPCTDPLHECAKLIAKYAETSDNIIIVAYNMTYQGTDTEEAIKCMTKCKNVYLCHTYEIRPYMNGEVYEKKKYFDHQRMRPYTPFQQWKLKSDKLCQWLDKEEKGLPTFSRIKRRAKYKGTKVTSRLFRGRSIRSKPRIKRKGKESLQLKHRLLW